jgi:hypothetical protein
MSTKKVRSGMLAGVSSRVSLALHKASGTLWRAVV